MNDLLTVEPVIRGTAFGLTILGLVVLEHVSPRRAFRRDVWPNVGLFLTNTFAIRLISVTSVTGIAAIFTGNGWGLFSHVDLPSWFEFAVAVICLDFTMYVQHRLFHSIPWLWRLHAVHHSDTVFDVSTGVRFHVGEMLVSFTLKLVAVAAIGASVAAVLTFEVLLSAASLFTHSNVRLPPSLDAVLRKLVVTPDVHRIHHSVERDEHNRNFGFLLIWWDRWIRSYREAPRSDHRSMAIGLDDFRSHDQQRLWPLLKQPFRRRGNTLAHREMRS